MGETLKSAMQYVSAALEISGVLVIVGGFVLAVVRGVQATRVPEGRHAYFAVRDVFGRAVLLGLEFLVAADLIRTVAVAPTLDNLLVLGLLVVIRTFLSWSLDVELEGVWPWRRHELERENVRR